MSGTVDVDRVRISELPLRQLLWEGLGARLFATYWGCVAVVDVTPRGFVTVAGIVALVGVCSVHLVPRAAIALAGTGWLFVVGFVSNAHGELELHGPGDMAVLALLLLAAPGCAAMTQRRRD